MFMNLGGSQNSSICHVKEALLSLGSRPAQISSLGLGPLVTYGAVTFYSCLVFKDETPLLFIVCLPSPGCNRECSWLSPFLSCGFKHSGEDLPFSLCCHSCICPSTYGWVGFTDVLSLIFFILKYIINFCKKSPDVFSARPSEP